MLEAVKYTDDAILYASEELKKDKEFAIKIVSDSGYSLKYLSDEFKSDVDVVAAAIISDSDSIKYADEKFKSEEGFSELISKVVEIKKETDNNEHSDYKSNSEDPKQKMKNSDSDLNSMLNDYILNESSSKKSEQILQDTSSPRK